MILSWYRRRKRSVLLGDSGHGPGFWCDPDTGEVWQASHRWSVFTVPSAGDAEAIISMLDHVQQCELNVPKEWGEGR